MPLSAAWVAEADRAGVPASWVEASEWFDVVESTNDLASRRAAAGAADGSMVVGGMQTAGRGRRGRPWSSPPGAGLYFSIVLRLPVPPRDDDAERVLVTLVAGVAVAEGLHEAAGVRAEIKWPNDLVVRRTGGGFAKLAGILAEASMTGGVSDVVVVGIGINLRRAAHHVETAVTSVEEQVGRHVDPACVWARTVAALARRRAELRDRGAAPLLDAWRAHSPSAHGSMVSWPTDAGRREGVTSGIDARGALLVTSEGERVALISAELTWQELGHGH